MHIYLIFIKKKKKEKEAGTQNEGLKLVKGGQGKVWPLEGGVESTRLRLASETFFPDLQKTITVGEIRTCGFKISEVIVVVSYEEFATDPTSDREIPPPLFMRLIAFFLFFIF